LSEAEIGERFCATALGIDLPRFGEIHSENWRQGVGVILRSGVFAASRRMAANPYAATILRDASLRDAPQDEERSFVEGART
jgi:hypothetical protein